MSHTIPETNDVDALEQRVDQKRANLNQTLNDVERQFSPQQLVDQTMGYFSEHGGDVARTLGQSVKENPIPLVLTGVGIAWLMASQSSSASRNENQYPHRNRQVRGDSDDAWYQSAYGDSPSASRPNTQTHAGAGYRRSDYQSSSQGDGYMDSALDVANEKMNELGDKADQLKDQFTSRVESLKQDSEESVEAWQRRAESSLAEAERMAYQAGRKMQRRGKDAAQWLQDQPLVAGALGIAAGALIGALLPSTKLENKYIGETADAVKAQAGDQVQQVASNAKDKLESTADNLKNRADDALEKVADAAISNKVSTSAGV